MKSKNLKKVALLAEVVGGLGIIISIVYLAFEVSDSSDAQLVANQLALAGRTQELNSLIVENAELGDLIAKSRLGVSALTPGQREQVNMYVYSKMAIWEDAKLRGVDFRAVGNEPGWNLEISADGEMVFIGNYGQTEYKFPTPEPSVARAGGRC